MKKIVLYTIGILGAIFTSWSAAITANVNPNVNKPIKVKSSYCKPGATRIRNGYRYICSAKGRWVRSDIPNMKVRKPKPKVHISY